MFNWNEIEQVARLRQDDISASLSEIEFARMEAVTRGDSSKRPLRTRLASALVRLSAHLDPEIALHPAHAAELDDLIEGRMPAYLR